MRNLLASAITSILLTLLSAAGGAPATEPARLSAVFQDLEAEVSEHGLLLISQPDGLPQERFRVSATRIGRQLGVSKELAHRGVVSSTQRRAAAYSRPGLVEEYSTSTDGIRQDFLVIESPEGVGPLVVELGVEGARARLSRLGVTLTLPGGREIAYGQLQVTDANGIPLEAQFDLGFAGGIQIVVEDDEATYPIRIDPTFSDADWVSMGDVPGVDRHVYALAVDPSGENLYIGGSFFAAGTVVANNIAKWDGSNWTALGSGVGGSVNAITVIGTDVYVGGLFTTAGGLSANRVAKWDGSNWSALGTGTSGSLPDVYALATDGTDLYVGGRFSFAGGVAVDGIARWDGTSWNALGSGLGGAFFPGVNAILISGSDVYIGGSFQSVGGISAKRVARWDGTTWSALGVGLNEEVHTLAMFGTDLYVGGKFSQAGGQSANKIARWDGTDWFPLGDGIGSTTSSATAVRALVVFGSDLYVAGEFTSAGPVNALGRPFTIRVAKWDGSQWSGVGPGIDSTARALAVFKDELYLGGTFQPVPGTRGITKWDGISWGALTAGTSGVIYALAVSGSDLYAGGDFQTIGGTEANHVAKWDGSSWSPLGSGTDSRVTALAVSGNDLYASGTFQNAGGTAAMRIAKWNGESWEALGSGLGGSANALAVSGSDLYAGGSFTSAGGTSAYRIAKWDGAAWSALASGIDGSFQSGVEVNALAISGSDLFIGGNFTSVSGTSADYIARWDGSTWSSVGSGMSFYVNALATSDGELYAGGQFITAGGASANRIARWDGSDWSPLGAGLDSTVNTMVFAGDDLFVSGTFSNAGGSPANLFARWDGSDWHAVGSGLNNPAVALVASTSNVYAGGHFTIAGGQVSAYAARLQLTQPQSFADWATTALLVGADAAPLAAPYDLKNLLKYAFGLDGSTFDSRSLLPGTGTSGLPDVSISESVDGVTLRLEFVRRIGGDASYVPKAGSDIDDCPVMTGAETVTPIDDSWERVVIEKLVDPMEQKQFCFVEVFLP